LTRASIILRKAFFEDGWIAGSSPAMTDCWTITCQSEHGTGNFVLVAGWQPAHGFERFVQQLVVAIICRQRTGMEGLRGHVPLKQMK
jgi:hypothetical protein